MSAKGLLIFGRVLLILNSGVYIAQGFKDREMLQKGRAAEQAAAKGKKLTEKGKANKNDYEEWRKLYRPTPHGLQIKDRAFIVTGASSGIGLSTAIALSDRGAKVALLARSTDALQSWRESLQAACLSPQT